MNYGFQNERDFVELFNDKHLYELDNKSQKFLKELFGEVIDGSEKIKSWKNKVVQKTDIFIKYKNSVRSISLKCGNNNSVHQESIENFKMYLEKLGIPYNTINKYVSYHYGYMRDKDGKIDFSHCLSADEYKSLFQEEIDIFNASINRTKIIIDMVDRFIVRGRNSDYDIDALVCGTVDDYVWLMKYDIYDLVLSKRSLDFKSPHVACMTIGPKKRNLLRNPNNAKDRYMVCIRWNFLKEDIIEFKSFMKG